MHALMKYEWKRYESFNLYPLTAPLSPLKLARAGFYYTGTNQTVKCFCCGEQYDANDYEELNKAHQRNSRNCSFIRGESSSNIPITYSSRSEDIFFGSREHQDMPQYRYLYNGPEELRRSVRLTAQTQRTLRITSEIKEAGFFNTANYHVETTFSVHLCKQKQDN
ncbi:E3 ubiquitin-protein ligase XIAP-like [Ruditapes philippinarum]|uniref:E3 ubiquitin-protein ligase XIAP-like n=1 Tax=Ruditapes philippinarum TaxID=129788 RepID=UPI00295B4732|nr:E3 ubiquitin-protein ligase XIAP-like [Ruditapes philippinarum]